MGKSRHDRQARMRTRLRTTKFIDRLTYNPNKHKRKEARRRVKELQARAVQNQSSPDPKPVVKFGAINVNGLDLDSGWAVQELLKNKNFDVSY